MKHHYFSFSFFNKYTFNIVNLLLKCIHKKKVWLEEMKIVLIIFSQIYRRSLCRPNTKYFVILEYKN